MFLLVVISYKYLADAVENTTILARFVPKKIIVFNDIILILFGYFYKLIIYFLRITTTKNCCLSEYFRNSSELSLLSKKIEKLSAQVNKLQDITSKPYPIVKKLGYSDRKRILVRFFLGSIPE